MQSPPVIVTLCALCGSVAAERSDRCTTCGAASAAGRVQAELGTDARWARVELSFRCVGCGFSSPLDHLDLDGTLSCAHCGLDQAFDVRAYSRVLSTAHDVVDLCGADPEVRRPGSALSRDNPYHHIGVSVSDQAWTEPHVVGGREALGVRVSPGHPLCARCHVPRVPYPSHDQFGLRCPRCNGLESYALVPQAQSFHPAVIAVVAPGHRCDVRQVSEAITAGGAAKLGCPHCGAPLTLDPHATSVTCAHCHQPSLISSKLWYRLGVREPRTEPIWLWLRGRSPRRLALEQRAHGVDPFELELQERARAVLAARGRPAPIASPPHIAPAPRAAPPALGGSPLQFTPAPRSNLGPLVVAAAAVLMLVLGAAVAALVALQ